MTAKRKSIMVSMQTNKRLQAIKKKMEKITGKKSLSEEQVILILLEAKDIENALIDLMLE